MRHSIEYYLKGLEIEADEESTYYEYFDITRKQSIIPRVLKLPLWLRRYSKKFDFFIPIVRLIYPLIISLIHLYQALAAVAKIIITFSKHIPLRHKNVYLDSSNMRNLNAISRDDLQLDGIILFNYKKIINHKTLPNVPRYYILDGANLIDIAKAFGSSLFVNWYYLWRSSEKKKTTLGLYRFSMVLCV